jgi:hypothetical protein
MSLLRVGGPIFKAKLISNPLLASPAEGKITIVRLLGSSVHNASYCTSQYIADCSLSEKWITH